MKKLVLLGLLTLALTFTSCSPSSSSEDDTPPPPQEVVCYEITDKYTGHTGTFYLESHPYNQPLYVFSVSESVYNSYSVGQDYCTGGL